MYSQIIVKLYPHAGHDEGYWIYNDALKRNLCGPFITKHIADTVLGELIDVWALEDEESYT